MLDAQRMTTENKKSTRDLALFVLLWVPYALLVWRFWFICDDAYISFRYARNWAEGHGLRYNLGAHVPVEGYSNFLWVAICTLIRLLNAEVTLWAPVLSFACGTVLLFLVFHTLRRRFEMQVWVAAAGALFLGCSPAYTCWSTSGLETMPFALLLFMTFERLVLRKNGPQPLAAGLAGLALALMRVEGVYWAILVIPLAVFAHRSSSPREWRPMIIYAALVGIGYAVYFAVRYSYYQLPFSNSTYVKMGLSGHTLGRGFDYLAVQFLAMLTPFLMFPGAVVALRRGRRSVGIPIVVVTFGMVAFTAVASGDFMAFGRLLVPGLAFNAILFAWLLQDLGGAAKGMRFAAGAIGLGIVAIGVLPAGEINVVPRSVRASFHFRLNSGDLFRSELEQWRFEKDNAREWGEIGRALADYADPGEALVAGAIGAIGYYSNLFIYDGFGLVTRKVSARDVTGPIVKSPGHDKAVPPTFFLEDRPIYLSVSMVAADSPAQAAEEIRIRAAGFRRGGPHRQYVPDYLPLGDGATDERIRYVFILKRIPDGVDPDDAWGEFAARLRRFAADPE